jgi:NADP-dependent 3-hydroxy acid dehydrogenase YdfG
MKGKVWFITGTSKGFGRVWAEAALARGDQVAATARDIKSLGALVQRFGDQVAVLALDVTDKAAVHAAIGAAIARFGRLDVVVNNAGYGLFGAIEEISEAEARAQIETNLFGALWVTQAALPIMRAQRSGHIIQVSSIGGVNAFPTVGLYHASKASPPIGAAHLRSAPGNSLPTTTPARRLPLFVAAMCPATRMPPGRQS